MRLKWLDALVKTDTSVDNTNGDTHRLTQVIPSYQKKKATVGGDENATIIQ
jgi:hypothetical protein